MPLVPVRLMGILDEDVVRVREAADIVAIVRQYTQLKRVGPALVRACARSTARRRRRSRSTRSWASGICFGCQAKGDVITFVREHRAPRLRRARSSGWPPRSGITLRYTDQRRGRGPQGARRGSSTPWQTAVDVVPRAAAHRRPTPAPARRYLRERGLRRRRGAPLPDRLGARRLGRAGPVAEPPATRCVQDAGLGFVNKRGPHAGLLPGRVLFPIFDAQGDPVAFGGRKLPGAEGPKYRNTPETRLYAKSKVLYGLNWAKDDVVQADEVIVCEGYTDVIGFAPAGLPRPWPPAARRSPRSTCGCCSASPADRAGLRPRRRRPGRGRAVLRVGAQARDRRRRGRPARRHGPGRPGPDAIPTACGQAVEQATPFLGFRVERDPRGERTVVHPRAGPGRPRRRSPSSRAPDELVRDQYVMEVADRCRLERRPAPRRAAAPGRPVPSSPNRRSTRRHAGPSTRPRPRRCGSRSTPTGRTMRRDLLDDVLFDDDLHLAAYRALRDAER